MDAVAEPQNPQTSKRLTRSPHGMIAGVCAGLSECFGISLVFTRLVFAVLALANGIGVVIYLILILVIPTRPAPDRFDSAVNCPPRKTKKTLFGYIAGAISVCAGLLTAVDNLSSIAKTVEELPKTVSSLFARDGGIGDVSAPREATPLTSFNSSTFPHGIDAVQGSVRITWRTSGVAYLGDIRMDGSLGSISVAFRDPENLEAANVQQTLHIEKADQYIYLVGSNPTRRNYYPDVFRLATGHEGFLEVVDFCDAQVCTPVDTANGRFYVAYR